MPEIDAARFGFAWGWDLGEDGWKDGMDKNMRMGDTFIGLCIIDDTLTAPPGSPNDGDTYIPRATATGAWTGHEGKIATYQNGAWYFYNVVKGLRALFVNHSDFRSYDGSVWSVELSYARLPAEVQNVPAAFPFVGRPPAGQSIFIPIVQDMDLPANFAGSVGYSNENATLSSNLTFSYIRSGSTTTIGTETFTNAGHFSTPSTQAVVHLLTNDILVCTAPNPQDATLADFTVTLLLKKV